MKQSSIVVFGEALVDVFKSASVVGGAPFNVARHLAGFGLNPLFLSAIGNDTNGDLVQQQISHFQLDPKGVQILVNQRTGIVQVHENELGHQFEIMPNCAYDFIETDAALACINAKNNTNLPSLSMLYHGTLGLRGEVSLQAFKAVSGQANKAKNTNIFLDINWRAGHVNQAVAMQCLQDANIIKLSIEELQMVLPWFNIFTACDCKLPSINNTSLPIKQLMTHFKTHLLLVTYGDLGSAAFNKDGVCEAAALGLRNKGIIDTVGAGDAFSSVMILAITQGWAMDLALQCANEFAAGICGIRGATPTDLTFYKQYLAAWNHLEK
jgi:fructokinase